MKNCPRCNNQIDDGIIQVWVDATDSKIVGGYLVLQ